MPFPGNPFNNIRPMPRYQPGKPTSPPGGNPFDEGLINVRPNIPAGRPDQWGNSKPWNSNPPAPDLNKIPSGNTGGQIVPSNNANGGITLPNNSSSPIPSNNSNWNNQNNYNYPDRPIETWNMRPDIGNGRPNRTPTIDVPARPVNNPPGMPIESPLNNDPLGAPIGGLGEWAGENFGRWLQDQWQRKPPAKEKPKLDNNFPQTNPTQPSQGKKERFPMNVPGTNRIKFTFQNHTRTVTVNGGVFENRGTTELVVTVTNLRAIVLETKPSVISFVQPYGAAIPGFYDVSGVSTKYYWAIEADFAEGLTRDVTTNLYYFRNQDMQETYQSGTTFDGNGNPVQKSYTSFSKTTINTEVISDNPNPEPNLVYFFDVTFQEDDMSCRPCQAAQALRSLQRTITVDSTPITPIPTGNLLVAPTVQKPMRVFALPGTEQSVKEQFNLIDAIRKNLAKTFNQSRMAKVLAKLGQVMQVTDFVLNLHTAMMMSSDIIESFWSPITSAVDTVVAVLDDAPFVGALFDLEEKSLNSSEILGNKFQDAMKKIFGVENWAQIQAKWASFNNIVRGAAMQIQAMKDIKESQRELGEMTASKLGRLHNKMVNAGVIFDSSMWEENVKARSVWLDKFYKLEELADDNPITNAASYVNSWGQQVLDIKEQKKELKESQEKYQKDLQKDLDVLSKGKVEKDENSTGSPYTRTDGNAPETDND